jgi:hypothetical protein
MPVVQVGQIVLRQLDVWRDWFFRPRVTGLTDDEYFWEPAPNCWSVRVDDEGRARCDWAVPTPEPPPVTTIAWRLAHVASNVLAASVARYFEGGRDLDYMNFPWPATANDAIALVEDGLAKWRSGLAAMSEDDFDKPLGPEEVYSVGQPFAVLALHINHELIHHGAEVCLLRDLYRARAPA